MALKEFHDVFFLVFREFIEPMDLYLYIRELVRPVLFSLYHQLILYDYRY